MNTAVKKEYLTVEQLLTALISGKKIKSSKADKGINYWLENGQLKSDTIGYLKAIPNTWFNPDIKYEIDD